jgi:type II restriction enzyme
LRKAIPRSRFAISQNPFSCASLTAINLISANYGMPINTNLCKNKFVKHHDKTIMLQAASIYTQGNGEKWDAKKMFDIMIEVSKSSLKALGSEIFNQITNNE